jgi:hypothetical protein
LVGTPWEIIRPDDVEVNHKRLLTIHTKQGGGTAGYIASAVLVSEYNLAITIHASGPGLIGYRSGIYQALLEKTFKGLVPYVDERARENARTNYAGKYSNGLGISMEVEIEDRDNQSGLALASKSTTIT